MPELKEALTSAFNQTNTNSYVYTRGGKPQLLRSHGSDARAIMSRSLGNWPGAKSDGDKTIWDPWAGPKFNSVKFWVLKSTRPAAP